MFGQVRGGTSGRCGRTAGGGVRQARHINAASLECHGEEKWKGLLPQRVWGGGAGWAEKRSSAGRASKYAWQACPPSAQQGEAGAGEREGPHPGDGSLLRRGAIVLCWRWAGSSAHALGEDESRAEMHRVRSQELCCH